MLGKGLQDTEFNFDTNVGARTVNALLKWIRELKIESVGTSTGKLEVIAKIDSYDQFKQLALNTYNRLNQDYNMGNLVPIYRIRREIGDQASRSQFSEWLFAMQSDDLLELLEEGVEDSAPDKIEDSVTTKLGKLRCYAKRLTK